MLDKEDLYKLLYDVCKLAYIEGRKHQFNDDWPDVGMYFKEDFEDTRAFKIIQEKKGEKMYDDILGPSTSILKLRKLTGDEIKALQEDDTDDYYVKLTRLYDPKPIVKWKGKVKFHVQRGKDVLTPKHDRLGVLTPKPDQIPISWAEYCEEDINDNGACVCEDYLMEIWKEI